MPAALRAGVVLLGVVGLAACRGPEPVPPDRDLAARAYTEALFAHKTIPAFTLGTDADGTPIDTVIGELRPYRIRDGDTLMDVARYYDVGYNEIVAANPGVDPWVPPVGATIVLPTAWVLPCCTYTGLVLNIPEMRLFYYERPAGRPRTLVVRTYPVGLGRRDRRTPRGRFRVRGKTMNPRWIVPASIRAEHIRGRGPRQPARQVPARAHAPTLRDPRHRHPLGRRHGGEPRVRAALSGGHRAALPAGRGGHAGRVHLPARDPRDARRQDVRPGPPRHLRLRPAAARGAARGGQSAPAARRARRPPPRHRVPRGPRRARRRHRRAALSGRRLERAADLRLECPAVEPLFDGDVRPRVVADVDLPRARDALLLVEEHLRPLRHPARGAGDREEHGEHLGREAHRVVDDPGVEVDVRVELARDEVVVLERDPLELERDVDERVLARHLEHLVGELLDDLPARIEVLVDPVAESHEPPLAGLHLLDDLGHALDRPDLAQHADDLLVGAAVARPRERRAGSGDHGVGVGERAADHARRGGGAVLLVVGVEDEEHVERPLEDGVRRVLELGHLEEHREEVAGVGQLVVRVDVRQAAAVAVGEGGDRGHLADQPPRLHPPRLEVHHVLRVGIEGRERPDRADDDAHRVGVVAEPLDEALDVLVEERVHADVVPPHLEVRGRRQLALDDEVGHLEVVALLGQLLDRVAAVAEDAALAVDVGDGALARGRV